MGWADAAAVLAVIGVGYWSIALTAGVRTTRALRRATQSARASRPDPVRLHRTDVGSDQPACNRDRIQFAATAPMSVATEPPPAEVDPTGLDTAAPGTVEAGARAALPVTAHDASVEQAVPTIAVVIAARDEAATIAASIDSFEHLRWNDLEIVLVDDRSTDDTGDAMRAAAATDPRIRVVRVDELPERWLGKVHALAQGASATKAEWLLFTDADVELQPEALELAMSLVRTHRLDHLALLPAIDAPRLLVAGAVGTFSRWLVIAARLWRATDPDSPIAFGVGAFNFVRREALEAGGGLEWLRMDVADDAALGALVATSGGRSMLASGTDVARVHWQTSVRGMTRGFEKYGSTGGIGTLPRTLAMTTLALLGELAPWLAFACGFIGVLRGFSDLSGGGSGSGGLIAGTAASVGIITAIVAVVVSGLLARTSGARASSALVQPIGAILVWWMQVRSCILEQRRGGLVWRDTFYATADLRAGKRYRLP